jgi:hypothetical protein
MMNPGDREKSDQQRWQARFLRGRLGLSASVEEALANPDQDEDDFDDDDDVGEAPVATSEAGGPPGEMLIRPRLSLQSKPFPAVRLLPRPVEQAASTDATPALHRVGTASLVEPTPPARKKKRLAGRNTRVELQAIPKQEKKAGRKTTPLAGRAESARVVVEGSIAAVKEPATEAPPAVRMKQALPPARERLSGTGMFLKGRAEATIENAHITPASVVLVTLLTNPGKVVVHYYTLLPGYGFTVHLSDEATADTPFNYAVLLGELL